MNRILLGLSGVGAMVLVVVGCSSSTTVTPGVAADTSMPSADTSTPKSDTSAPKKDSGKTETDSGAAEDFLPSCYLQVGDEVAASSIDSAAVDTNVKNFMKQFEYHAPFAKQTGACSAADITAFGTAFSNKNSAARDASAPADAANFDPSFVVQFDTAGVAGVSDSCKSCILHPYTDTNMGSGDALGVRKWGVSGLFETTDRKLSIPTDLMYINQNGCFENRGIVTQAEAAAQHDMTRCLDAVCPIDEAKLADNYCSEASQAECFDFAATKGACRSYLADAQSAVTKMNAALSADGGSSLCDLSSIVGAFCGN